MPVAPVMNASCHAIQCTQARGPIHLPISMPVITCRTATRPSPADHPSVKCAQKQGYIGRSTHYEGRRYMSDAREYINDPRIYDETDDLLVEFSALVSIYTDKPEAIETEYDLLHRWISIKANEYRIEKYTEKIADIKISDEKIISYKTNARQFMTK